MVTLKCPADDIVLVADFNMVELSNADMLHCICERLPSVRIGQLIAMAKNYTALKYYEYENPYHEFQFNYNLQACQAFGSVMILVSIYLTYCCMDDKK